MHLASLGAASPWRNHGRHWTETWLQQHGQRLRLLRQGLNPENQHGGERGSERALMKTKIRYESRATAASTLN